MGICAGVGQTFSGLVTKNVGLGCWVFRVCCDVFVMCLFNKVIICVKTVGIPVLLRCIEYRERYIGRLLR